MDETTIDWGTVTVHSAGNKGYTCKITIPKKLARVKDLKPGDEVIFKTLPDGTIILLKNPSKVMP